MYHQINELNSSADQRIKKGWLWKHVYLKWCENDNMDCEIGTTWNVLLLVRKMTGNPGISNW